MMVMPVSSSPASIARWIGAAPRQRGSSDAWMLRQPWRGSVEHVLRQDQAVGGDDHHVGRGRRSASRAGGGIVGEAAVEAQAARLRDGDAVLERERLHRRRHELHAATGRPVGLAHHERDLEAGRVDAGQRDARELRRAGEDDAHAGDRAPA